MPPSAQDKPATEPTDVSTARAVMRDAKVELTTDAPSKQLAAITRLVDARGGFVASTDTTNPGRPSEAVVVVARVPSAQFASFLDGVRSVGTPIRETVSGKDVTEELVDLGARLRAQRAIEAQYLQILSQAKSVPDLLEVQKKLGEVRGEIERAEGRKRWLDDQVAFSTFHVTLRKDVAAAEIGADRPFSASVGAAAHDAVQVVRGGVHFGIRVVGVMLPLALLLSPALLAIWWLHRRSMRKLPAAKA